MIGKEKCKALKEIRAKIAEENDIEYVVSECKHKGDCKGTCPKCEAELVYLEKELAKRRSLGKKVYVTGLAVGMAATMSGCVVKDAIIDPVVDFFGGSSIIGGQDLAGAAEPYPPDTQGMGEFVEEPPVNEWGLPVYDDNGIRIPYDENGNPLPYDENGNVIEELDGDVAVEDCSENDGKEDADEDTDSDQDADADKDAEDDKKADEN